MDLPRKSTSSRNMISRPSVHNYSKLSLDPKNFSEKQFQLQVQREIIQFFQEHCPDVPITIKHLQTPNTKDYILVFTTLMRMIDPLYELAGKMEDEIPGLLKALGYPYTISKNSLLAVGAPNSWPSLLASLSWLVDGLRVSFRPVEVSSKDPSHQIALKAYEMFLTTHDFSEELNEMILLLEANFNENHEKLAELVNLNKTLTDDKERLSKVKTRFEGSDSLISKTKSQIFNIKSICVSYTSNIKEHEDRIHFLMSERERLRKNLEEINSKNAELAKTVQTQEYSVEDIERIRNEIKSLDSACQTIENNTKQMKDTRMKTEKHCADLDSEYSTLFEEIVAMGENHPYLKEQLGESFSSATLQKSVSEQEVIIEGLDEKLSKVSGSILNHIEEEIAKKKEEDKEMVETIKKLSALYSELDIKLQAQVRATNSAIADQNQRKTYLLKHIEEQTKTLEGKEEEVKKLQESLGNKKVNLKILQGNIEKTQVELARSKETFKARELKINAEIEEAFSTCMNLVDHVEFFKSSVRSFMQSQRNEVEKIRVEFFNNKDRFK